MSETILANKITTTNNTLGDADPAEPTSKGKTTSAPNPEVNKKRQNRRYSADYKLATLSEIDRCTTASERGAIMRREGLYASLISEWRKSRDAGALSALSKLRGRKNKYDAKDHKIAELEKEMATLKGKLAQAEAIIDVQKKVSEIFGTSIQTNKKTEN